MPEPKRIPRDAIPAALEKALRYRLLNEPLEAESICRDILEVDPDHQQALVTLVLALTEQFEKKFHAALAAAREIVPQVQGEYEQAYYMGIINERWAKSHLSHGAPTDFACGWFREAMRCYEKAEKLSKPDDPDAILRWNTCVRFLAAQESDQLQSERVTHDIAGEYGDDVPLR